MVAPDEEFLTVAEIAEILKLNQQTVRNWIGRGELPAVRVGRRVRILRSDFDRLIQQAQTQKPTQPVKTAAEAFWEGELYAALALDPSGKSGE